MKHIIEAGCDGAMLCIFDAAALPGDFDARVEDDPVALMESLGREEMFWSWETGGDGRFTVHVFVDAEPPPDVMKRGRELRTFEHFQVPGGRLWICGAEYAANDPLAGSAFTPKGGLRKFPGMGGSMEMAAGRYGMRVLALEWSEKDRETRLRAAMPGAEFRKARWVEVIGGASLIIGGLGLLLAVVMGLALIASTVYHYFARPEMLGRTGRVLQIWGAVTATGVLLFAIGLALVRRRVDPGSQRKLDAVRREMADYVLVALRIP